MIIIYLFFIVFFFCINSFLCLKTCTVLLYSSSSVAKDLGNACQNIWNAAGNNLKVPLELKVDTVGKNPLFKLEPAGQTKVDSEVFTTFASKSLP